MNRVGYYSIIDSVRKIRSSDRFFKASESDSLPAKASICPTPFKDVQLKKYATFNCTTIWHEALLSSELITCLVYLFLVFKVWQDLGIKKHTFE